MIVLGSKSPRRNELLQNMGYKFIVDALDVSEDVTDYQDPFEYVEKTALKKGREVKKLHQSDLVICADTIVVFNSLILEKPKSKTDAYNMIKMLQGNTHFVYTAVYLGKENKEKVFVEETKVDIDDMTEEEINEYIATSEPYDKAGGYAIQGIFSRYVKKIDGDFYNVMGLPVNRLYQEIKNWI